MFDNTIAAKRMLKKNALIEALSIADKEGNEWKKRQIEGKIACFERKYHPNIFWDSMKHGTYKYGMVYHGNEVTE